MPRRTASSKDHREPLIKGSSSLDGEEAGGDEGQGGGVGREGGAWEGGGMDYSDEGVGGQQRTEDVSWLRIVCINAHAFNYGLFYASVGVILLPEEALRMFEGSHAVALAAMLVLGGISQLVAPVAGYWSDRTTSSMGRRMPYILMGNVTLFTSLGFMYLARTYMYGKVYMMLLLVAMISLNVAYTGFAGLVSDVVPAHQMGVTSGIMGGMTAAGAVAGLISLGFLLPLEAAYPAYGLSVLLTTPITWAFAKEEVLDPSRARPYLKEEVLQAYYISPTSHGDFFWVFCSRTGYYMAVSTQIYILYYLRDCMTDPQISANAKTYTAMLCIISQGCSGIVSLVAGHMTARFGYKPLIYGACVVMASVYIGYTLVHSFAYVVALGIVYGSSNGVYLAADYALAVDCLPNKDDGAKDLALWGIAAFLGTMFGPCITGPTLAILGKQPDSDSYAFRGYVGVMMLGVVYSFLASCFLFKVKHGNPPEVHDQEAENVSA